ncbi:MAG: polysaccharide biosynthesis/export family protein [Armatimonadota bacterium]
MGASGRSVASRAAALAALSLLLWPGVFGSSPLLAAAGAELPQAAGVGSNGSGGEPAGAIAGQPADYLLHVGDKIRLWVWGEPSLTTEVVVMPDGTVSLPLIGTLHLLGKSVPAATKEVEEACGRYLKEPRVSLSCIPESPLHVYVEGSVSSPGPVAYDPRHRLLDYLERAGGPTTGADLSNVVVTSVSGSRVGSTRYDLSGAGASPPQPGDPGAAAGGSSAPAPVDAKEPAAEGATAEHSRLAGAADSGSGGEAARATPNPVLSPGDTVWVGRAVPVAVIGAVRVPGAIDYRQGMRLSEYVSLAGGPTVRADLRRAVLRHTKDGVTTSGRFDVGAALTNPNTLEYDPVLAPGDVIAIPEQFLAEGITWSDVLRVVTAGIIWWDR